MGRDLSNLKYLVVGAGGTGGATGAHLARGGHDVTLIVRGKHLEAIRENGLPAGKSPVHRLTPSIEGAYLDMKAQLSEGFEPARGYFADNDLIAIGAIRAFQTAGYRIPEDIAVIGFDNMPTGNYISPGLTTVNVPKKYMGEQAVLRLKTLLGARNFAPTRLMIGVNLVERGSVG